MALSLKDPEVDRLAREVAAETGENLTEAVRTALQERLVNLRLRSGQAQDRVARAMEIARRCAALPDIDPRTADEIVGYDEHGMW